MQFLQAIEVKMYMDTNGNSKLKATCKAGSLIAFKSDMAQQARHENKEQSNEVYAYLLASALADKLKWIASHGLLSGGTLKNGNYVFVFTS